jgi:hypothetical protein
MLSNGKCYEEVKKLPLVCFRHEQLYTGKQKVARKLAKLPAWPFTLINQETALYLQNIDNYVHLQLVTKQ